MMKTMKEDGVWSTVWPAVNLDIRVRQGYVFWIHSKASRCVAHFICNVAHIIILILHSEGIKCIHKWAGIA
jgi:hypothetical protein